MDVQRLRVTFGRGESIKYISHLDLMRLWERVLRRAEVPVSHSEGFNPRPKLALAAPLPVGVTSQAELMDVYLRQALSPYLFMKKVAPASPPGLEVRAVEQVGLRQPSLQSALRHIDYDVEVESDRSPEAVEAAVADLLAAEHLVWERPRDTGVKRYDLRATVLRLNVAPSALPGRVCLTMRLRSDPSGSGRPEDVCAVLRFEARPLSIHRTALGLAPPPRPSLRRYSLYDV